MVFGQLSVESNLTVDVKIGSLGGDRDLCVHVLEGLKLLEGHGLYLGLFMGRMGFHSGSPEESSAKSFDCFESTYKDGRGDCCDCDG